MYACMFSGMYVCVVDHIVHVSNMVDSNIHLRNTCVYVCVYVCMNIYVHGMLTRRELYTKPVCDFNVSCVCVCVCEYITGDMLKRDVCMMFCLYAQCVCKSVRVCSYSIYCNICNTYCNICNTMCSLVASYEYACIQQEQAYSDASLLS
jgi:hypothetical protein